MQEHDLAATFSRHRARVEEIFRTGEWARYGDEFAEHATYRRSGYADFRGREEIRPWVVERMSSFPGNRIAGMDVGWRSLDPGRNRVAAELISRMSDPGDGSSHSCSTTSLITFGDDGLIVAVEDLHSPDAIADMFRSWSRVALRLGTLTPADARILDPRRGTAGRAL